MAARCGESLTRGLSEIVDLLTKVKRNGKCYHRLSINFLNLKDLEHK